MNITDFKEGLELWRTPERVALLTGVNESGHAQVITISWFTRVSFGPPMFAIAIGSNRSMRLILEETRECVLAIPGIDLAEAVIGCGQPGSGLEDRFEKYNLEAVSVNSVASPMIKNCIVNYACLVKEKVDAGDHTVFILKVVETRVFDEKGKNLFLVNQTAGCEVVLEQGPYKLGYVK